MRTIVSPAPATGDRCGTKWGSVVEDPEATAAVVLGAITSFKVFQALLGEPPARLDDESFERAWMRVMMRGFGVGDAADPGEDEPAE